MQAAFTKLPAQQSQSQECLGRGGMTHEGPPAISQRSSDAGRVASQNQVDSGAKAHQEGQQDKGAVQGLHLAGGVLGQGE